MAAEAILVIGEATGCAGLIVHALIRGYRVLFSAGFGNGNLLSNQKHIRVIIIGKTSTRMNDTESKSLVSLMESGVSVILAPGQGMGGIITDAFQSQVTELSQGSENTKQISKAVKRFFDEGHQELTENDYLLFGREKDLTFLELRGNGSIQKVQWRIRRAITFMEQCYKDDLSLEQIAHAAYLSSYHFCRLFKKQTGMTCNKYLSILRIAKAKELLRATEMSVTDICYETGFNNLTHFERVFKGLEGVTPSAYRQYC